MSLTKLKTDLQQLEKPQLIALIGELYKSQKAAREYLDFYFAPDDAATLLAAYRERVLRAPQARLQLRLTHRQSRHQRLSQAWSVGPTTSQPAAALRAITCAKFSKLRLAPYPTPA